jgi:hypothetical protein
MPRGATQLRLAEGEGFGRSILPPPMARPRARDSIAPSAPHVAGFPPYGDVNLPKRASAPDGTICGESRCVRGRLVEVVVADALQEFLVDRRLWNLPEGTIDWYGSSLRRGLHPLPAHSLTYPLATANPFVCPTSPSS